jgi:hypothetical protein
MQRLERPEAPPAALRSKAADQARRQMRTFWALETERRAQTSVPDVALNWPDGRLVDAVASFSRGRCAFCEATDDLTVHRFRPAGNALPQGASQNPHLYYFWLADAWQNLYPICQGCIPSEPQFPVSGERVRLPSLQQVDAYVERGDGIWPSFPNAERNVLLDPVRDRDFERHLLPNSMERS